jgi:polyhydroxyalkanoate synthesis regulator phasin
VRDKEVAALKSQMKSLNETLEAINQRLAQLENPVE